MFSITLPSESPNMASQSETLTLQQDQDISPVRDNPQKASQSKAKAKPKNYKDAFTEP